MTATLFTSRIFILPDSFGYEEIRFDIENSLSLSNPIFLYINDEKSIKIEQIRDLQKELASPPVDPLQTRVVLIHPMERLLHVAQQSLLKMLEEPPERTVIILAGSSLSNLAPTILSRVQVERRGEESKESNDSIWPQVTKATDFSDYMKILSQAPEKKDEALAWIRQVLASKPTPSEKTNKFSAALTEAYEALLSNVTPKLVWARVVKSSSL